MKNTILIRLTAVIALFMTNACSILPPSLVGVRSSVAFKSVDGSKALRPAMPTRLYRFVDENSADVILTDLTLEQLTSVGAPPVTGQIVHLQLFIRPLPGRTPIAREACSTTIRSAVLARGQVGIYGGGGFLIPESKPGGELFGGSMADGSIRLLKSTDLFVDRLGPASTDVSFTAKRDDSAVTQWLTLMDRLALVSTAIAPPQERVTDESEERADQDERSAP